MTLGCPKKHKMFFEFGFELFLVDLGPLIIKYGNLIPNLQNQKGARNIVF